MKTLAIWCLCVIQLVRARTVCDVVLNKEHVIQAVVIPNTNQGLMFVNDIVYEFNPETNFNEAEHALYLQKSGQHVERFFDGVYLKGNHIFNVYSLFTNETRMYFFIMTNDDENKVAKDEEMGFSYEVNTHKSYRVKNAAVAKDFPFVYFGNNYNLVYLYQIPVYTFGMNPVEELKKRKFGYFSFNLLDQRMEYKVAENDDGPELERTLKLLKHKLPLRSAFTYKNHVYLITSEHVYVLEENEMKTNALPKFHKKSLNDFLKCDSSASVESINWNRVITIILSIILMIIIIVLIFAITSPKQLNLGARRTRHESTRKMYKETTKITTAADGSTTTKTYSVSSASGKIG